MARKQTTEFMALMARFVDSTFKSMEDGKFDPLRDFNNYIDDFISIQPAVEGLSEIKQENISMTIPEREALQKDLEGYMPNVPVDDRYDIALGMAGALSWFRIGWRRGAKEGREALLKELKDKGVDLSALEDAA